MNRQRGIGEIYLIGGAVVIAMGAALAVQTYRLKSCQAEYAEFKGGVEALGRAAEKAAKDREAKDKANKEKADADQKRLSNDLAAALKRLRDSNSGRGGLSSPSPATPSASGSCFDAAKLDRALRSLDAGILGIVESGSQAVNDLDSVRRWAQQRP